MSDPLTGAKFYALIETGRLECPRCGRILLFGYGAKHPDNRFWNPVSSILQCSKCLSSYQLGMIAWPTRRGTSLAVEATPSDQIADVRQLAEIRQRTGGFWAYRKPHPPGAHGPGRPRRLHKGAVSSDPVNKWVPEGCCCAPLPWRQECPVHGGIGWDRAAESAVESRGEGESEPD